MCRNPFVKDGAAYGCGQCLPCRVNRRRVWCHRLELENRLWSESAFVTLTYDNEHLPFVRDGVASLVPKHFTLWLKRLRFSISPARMRYYGCGEYGREGERAWCWNPHYHVLLFGYKTCEYGDSSLSAPRECKCASCSLVRSTWGLGRVHLGSVTDKSIQYVSGYIVEKLRTRGELDGRVEEFARMSLRPGIGGGALRHVADAIGRVGVERFKDVPAALRVGKRVLPLGRYLTRKLRRELGRDEGAPSRTLAVYEAKMLSMRARAERFAADKKCSVSFALRKVLLAEGAEKARQMEVRLKLFERGKK